MDKAKMPFIPEDTIRIQRVKIYLYDLKQRLRELREKHEAVIQNSVDFFEELNGVSTSLVPDRQQDKGNKGSQSRNIQNLIQDFEKLHHGQQISHNEGKTTDKTASNMESVYKNMELNTSQLLQESRVLCQDAKNLYENFDNLVSKVSSFITSTEMQGGNLRVETASDGDASEPCHTFKDKILMFDEMSRNRTSNAGNQKKPLRKRKRSNKSNVKSSSSNISCNKKCKTNKSSASEGSDAEHEEIHNATYNESSTQADHDEPPEFADADEPFMNVNPSCTTSYLSVQTFHTANEFMSAGDDTECQPVPVYENGYEGDCDDSEFHLHSYKRQKISNDAKF